MTEIHPPLGPVRLTAAVEPEGVLTAVARYADGREEVLWVRKNLITRSAKLELLRPLWATSAIPDPITTFKVGTGGAIDPEGRFPNVESPTATGLVSEVASVTTSYVVYEDTVKVTFLADISESLANGELITEAGLFKASGAMFNVKNFPAIPKTSEFSLHFAWSVRIV